MAGNRGMADKTAFITDNKEAFRVALAKLFEGLDLNHDDLLHVLRMRVADLADYIEQADVEDYADIHEKIQTIQVIGQRLCDYARTEASVLPEDKP